MVVSDWIPDLEEAALDAIKDENSCLVIAGPGAGKTELLAQKVDYLFSTNKCIAPQKILALSFKIDAAANLKERVRKRYGDEYASRFTSLTYSAFEKRILDQFRNVLPENKKPLKDYTIRNNKYSNGKSILSFEKINMLALEIIKSNEYIRKALQMTYKFVFLDEFQDTTRFQYELIKNCFQNSLCRLTAVGDDKQAIMEWADKYKFRSKHVFLRFVEDFKANKKQLLTNYRSTPKLIELQKSMYPMLNSKFAQAKIPLKSQPDKESEITLFEFKDDETEAEYISENIVSRIEKGTPPNNICILAKNKLKDYSSKLIASLKSRGVRARLESDYQEILKDPVCNVLLDLISSSQGQKNPSVWENIDNFYSSIAGVSEYTGELAWNQYRKEIDDLKKYISKLISKPVPTDCKTRITDFIENIIKKIGTKKIISNFSKYSNENDLKKVIDNFGALLYIEYLQANGNWKDTISNFKGENSIPIMTIHKSKGLEYETVYFIGLEDGALWNFENNEVEEMKTFFVAISRAKSNLIFTHCKKRNGKSQYNKKIDKIYSLLTKSDLVNIKTI